MKRLLFFLLLLLMCAISVEYSTASAQTKQLKIPYSYKNQTLYYNTFVNGTAEVAYNFKPNKALTGVVEIPSTITDGSGYTYKVKKIANKAFQQNSKITKIVLSEGIEEIGTEAMRDMNSLKEVVFPHSLRKIAKNAVFALNKIERLYIPAGVEEIEDNPFGQTSKLQVAYIGNCVNKWGHDVFHASAIDTLQVYWQSPPEITKSGTYPRSLVYSQTERSTADIVLVVPRGTKAIYEAMEGWSDVKEIVERDSYDIAIDTTGYATACFPTATRLPDGAEGAIIGRAADAAATAIWHFTASNRIIPPNTPIIVRGTIGSTYHFAQTDTAMECSVNPVPENLLRGGEGRFTAGENERFYVLSIQPNHPVGFYAQTGTGARSVTNGKYRAYLAVPSSVVGEVQGFALENNRITAISAPAVEQDRASGAAPEYDLSGRRALSNPKGVVISQGKKLLR